jgi:hypothetical protein
MTMAATRYRDQTQTKTKSPASALLLIDDYTPMEFVVMKQTLLQDGSEQATRVVLHAPERCGDLRRFRGSRNQGERRRWTSPASISTLQCNAEKA